MSKKRHLIIVSIVFILMLSGCVPESKDSITRFESDILSENKAQLTLAFGDYQVVSHETIEEKFNENKENSITIISDAWTLSYTDAMGQTQTCVVENRFELDSQIMIESQFKVQEQLRQTFISALGTEEVIVELFNVDMSLIPVSLANQALMPQAITPDALPPKTIIGVQVHAEKMDEAAEFAKTLVNHNLIILDNATAWYQELGIAILNGLIQENKIDLSSLEKSLS